MGNGKGMRNANMCPLRCNQRYLLLLLYTASSIFCFSRVHVKSFFNKVLYEIQTDLDETYIPQLSEVLSTATSLRFQWELWTYDTSKGSAPNLQTGQAEEHHMSVNASISPLNYLLLNSEAFRAWVNDTTKKYVVILRFRCWAGKYCGEIIMQNRINSLWRMQTFEIQEA